MWLCTKMNPHYLLLYLQGRIFYPSKLLMRLDVGVSHGNPVQIGFYLCNASVMYMCQGRYAGK